ncbi:MAG: glycosyltransferase [Deltaproteobacteria bacterium]|nr:glycosyltransferase [Deltaproteobacteria bacterium]
MAPALSVLLPIRDAERTLAVALGSVLRSRAVDLEVVAVLHGCRDRSAAVLSRVARGDPRVLVVDAAPALSLGGALELGRARCRAPLIARMDADDVMHPERLAADAAWLAERPRTGAVGCRVRLAPRHAPEDGRHAGLVAYLAWQNAALSAADHQRELWIEQPLCHPATTFRTAALDAVGGWRTSPAPFPEDYDLFLRLSCAGWALEKRAALHHAWRIHAGLATRNPRDLLARVKAEHLVARFGLAARPVIVCGAGKEGRRIARALATQGVEPAAFVDVAPDKVGRRRRNLVVRHADELAALRAELPGSFALGAVGTSGARGVVRAGLERAGFVEGESFVVVA